MTPTGDAYGCLYLVPAPLDFMCDTQVPVTHVMPMHTLEVASGLSHWVCENAKSTRAFLKRVDAVCPLTTPLQAQTLLELPRRVHKKGDHIAGVDTSGLLAAVLAGNDMGLTCEAGMPAVADPGSSLVRAAHDAGVRVLPLVGPSSLLLALAASGLNGQHFAFVGYLPQEPSERGMRIKALEQRSLKTGETQICIETPYRNQALWQALIEHLQGQTRLSCSSHLSMPMVQTVSKRVSDWQKTPWVWDKNTPVVFAFGP